jgi:hypothetical protein
MINETKQTPVDWFKQELEDYGSSSHLSLDWNTFDELCQQAKEMEKLKAFEIFKAGQDSMEEGGLGFEQFWEQKYGGNK